MPRGGSRPGERRGGRKKGTPNKLTANVRAARAAFADAGGKDYLVMVAKTVLHAAGQGATDPGRGRL